MAKSKEQNYNPYDKEEEIINLLAKGFYKPLSNQEKESIGEYYINYAPRKLYKYRWDLQERDLQALTMNRMWFSNCKLFNDPFECTSNTNYARLIDKLLKGNTEVGKNYISLSKLEQISLQKNLIKQEENNISIIENFKDEIVVSCLSERNDSTLMWGHYGNSHKGYCVEYDILDLSRETNKTYIPVKYSNKMPELKGFEAFDIPKYILELVRTKAEDWNYEQEWRCVQDKVACGARWCDDGALLDVSAPTAVYLGCRADNLVDPFKEVCSGILKIPLYQMKIKNGEYTLFSNRII